MSETLEIQAFESNEFGEVRAYTDEGGTTTFCGNDVAKALGYSRPRDAVRQHCRGAVFRRAIPDVTGRRQATRFIEEADVYRLVTHSKLSGAKRFESWVFGEVLPSIRQHGGYISAPAEATDEEIMARALMIANETIKRRDRQIEAMRPKAELADALMGGDGTCSITEACRYLAQTGLDVTVRGVTEDLKARGLLCKGKGTTAPTRVGVDSGRLVQRVGPRIAHKDGTTSDGRAYAHVTRKGVAWLLARWSKDAQAAAR